MKQLVKIQGTLMLIVLSGCTGAQSSVPGESPTSIAAQTNSLPIAVTSTFTPAPSMTLTATSTITPTPVPALEDKFKMFPWVAYSPTNYDPAGTLPSSESIKEDLTALYDAGFRGIVTYGSSGAYSDVPRLAHELGFEGIIAGIWTPGDPVETRMAIQASSYVDGYVVGNEGLFFKRYTFTDVKEAIVNLKSATSKPVTTTEIVSSYFNDKDLREVGDWIFPNAHPYWAGITDPEQAARWTQDTYNDLKSRAGTLPLVFKEVGLPSAGSSQSSEYVQAEYYVRLRDNLVSFIYFEAFDQPWKSELNGTSNVGPHWGLFNSDRTRKVAASYILQGYPPFYIYSDAGAPHDHFVPEGFMGCWRGIKVNEKNKTKPYLGETSVIISWAPCSPGWGGIYWWDPPDSIFCDKAGGYDLTGWTKLTFWARGEKGGEEVEFKVGGLRKESGAACDSMTVPRTTHEITLTTEWSRYEISLYAEDLSHIAGGFVWVTNSEKPITLYLDEIRFEWSDR